MRDFIVTVPDRLKVGWYRLSARVNALLLRLVDRFLQKRGEERVSALISFEDLPVLYDFGDLPYLRGDFGADFTNRTENLALMGEVVV